MNTAFTKLSIQQRKNAIQRLTALWAFAESGLGGIMHALQIPFTGLVVGGMAVIIISMIAELAEHQYRQILTSTLVVLIVKAMVSPYTPFTAYIAVAFQALLGYSLFSVFSVNFISIALLCVVAMLESAIQKLLVLTLFFGASLWKAMDSMVAFIAGQFGFIISSGSYWIIGIYLAMYLIGGFFIAWFTYRMIKKYSADIPAYYIEIIPVLTTDEISTKSKRYKKIGVLVVLMICLSALLFVFAADKKQGWVEVIKTISWTLSAILIWFMLIGPLLTNALKKLLRKKESRYSDELLSILSFLPVLKLLARLLWQQSKSYRGFKKWTFFLSSLIHAALTYSEPLGTEPSNSKA